jgi:peptide deformylase
MAQLAILVHPDRRLRTVAQPVRVFDAQLAALVSDMFDTLYATRAIGLAATQVDRHIRLVVIDVSGDATAPQVFVNPEILAQGTPGIVEESCLSVPGVCEKVTRATEIRARALDAAGNAFERDLSGVAAVCLQHEMDHLLGKLFTDRLSFFRRWRAMRALAIRH